MDAFVAKELLAGLDSSGHDFAEFFRSSTLSLTVAHWPAGSVDGQEPHTEDEVYVVLAGRSRFTAGTETREVRPGDVIFVAAEVPHRFHDIVEELRIVVVFGPAEYSRAPAAG